MSQQYPDDLEPPPVSENNTPPPSEPIFNLPAIIIGIAVFMVLVHALREWGLSRESDQWVILVFSFIPARYSGAFAEFWPMAKFWSPFTYSVLHGNWMHLLVNLLWLAAFGSPVAARLGTARTLVLAAVTSLGGAAAHWLAFQGEVVPMIGASAVVSGFMGAATRFAFTGTRIRGKLNVHGPALSLWASLSNPNIAIFLIVWFGLNYLFGSGMVPLAGADMAIAWQAHVGGFLAGLLLFPLVDRKSST
ncbi:MAG: rhomboid family intramembrane serine protease [Nitratireductor sp.]|nr:rhomboid family intramembrane serine protease [Nitratireductor sp.]